jgi:hypothetical protein
MRSDPPGKYGLDSDYVLHRGGTLHQIFFERFLFDNSALLYKDKFLDGFALSGSLSLRFCMEIYIFFGSVQVS